MSLSLKLQPNDKVALVCPGCICVQQDHPQIAQKFLNERYHLQAFFAEDTTKGLAAAKRAEILLEYLFNDDIKLIAALRGGEGTADILPYIHLHYEEIKKLKPKFLLGLSDFTALLVYFAKYYHWPAIHGSNPLQFALGKVDEISQKSTMDLLFGNKTMSELNDLVPLNTAAKENKNIEANLTGGNLSVIAISIKDIWEINTDNKIVFFEDVGEKAHKIIRTLKYFSRIGIFKNATAIIFGDFTSGPIGCKKDEQLLNTQAILKTLSSFASHHDLPVLSTQQIGHGKTNLPLMYSTNYLLKLGTRASLKIKVE